jgi:type IV secretion system protein VirD4
MLINDPGAVTLGYAIANENIYNTPNPIVGFQSKNQHTVPEEPVDNPVFYDGSAHLMTVAPTGTGKGISVVIPTLLSYPGSVVVLDPKGENYAVTARARREMGQKVIRLNPFDIMGSETDALNFLDVFKLPNIDIETEAQLLAELFSSGNKGSKEPFWDLAAGMLLAGVIGYVVSVLPEDKRNFTSVRNLLFSGNASDEILEILDLHADQMPRATYHQLAAFLSMPEQNTRPSILATANAYLAALMSDDVEQASNSSSFSLLDFRDGAPISIYIVIPPDKLSSHSALIKLWVGVLLRTITSREEIPELQTLFILDEIGQLGHFSYLYSIVTLCRGYGLKCWTIWQDFQQLEGNYPNDWQTLMNNCGVLQFFGPKNHQIAGKIEQVTGVPVARIKKLLQQEQILVLDGEIVFAKKMDYLLDPEFAGKFDANPFYKRKEISGNMIK